MQDIKNWGKKAIVFGATGQTGSYLCDLLLERGYDVIGVSRHIEHPYNENIAHISSSNFSLECGDISDYAFVDKLFLDHMPDKIFNMAARSHVGTSYNKPLTAINDVVGMVNILESCKRFKEQSGYSPGILFAASSEMFGNSCDSGQDINTPMIPESPYAIAKLSAFHYVRLYRESYGLNCCSSISFNHESERRGRQFVTRKITDWIGRYVNGLTSQKLQLGNISTHRDWTHAKDTARAMIAMLESEKNKDYVISSGETHSILSFLQLALHIGGLDEHYTEYVDINNPEFVRPSDVNFLLGDSTPIRTELGWNPEYSFEDLVKVMVESDISYYE